MRVSGRIVLMSIVLAVAARVLAEPDPIPDEPLQNRQRLANLRADPTTYARLKSDLRDFQALAPERQAELRKLDHDLHEADPAAQARYWRVFERYAAWLERLPEDKRAFIQAAPDGTERARRVKKIKEDEWIGRLPQVKRQQVPAEPGPERAAKVQQLRDEERKRRREWDRVLQIRGEGPAKSWPPLQVAELPRDVRLFLENSVLPAASREDGEALKNSEGKWPLFGKELVRVVERHSQTVMPGAFSVPGYYAALPPEVKPLVPAVKGAADSKRGDRQRLSQAENKWPDYAIEVNKFLRSKPDALIPRELGPCRPQEFEAPVRDFILTKLLPRLDATQREQLKKAEGRWPDYPVAVMALAKAHELALPPATPPGPREFWDRLRVSLTDVPNHMLEQFARTLNGADRRRLQLSYRDPESLERLKEELFKRRPELLKRLHEESMARPPLKPPPIN